MTATLLALIAATGKSNAERFHYDGDDTVLTLGYGFACALTQSQATTSATHTDVGQLTCWGSSNPSLHFTSDEHFVQVSASADHACGVKASDRSIACWGKRAPTISGVGYEQIACGLTVACALSNNGTVECFGANNIGQSSPPAGGIFVQISCAKVCYAYEKVHASLAALWD